MNMMKTALVHDWLYTYAGSERVVEAILHCFPAEQIYTLVDFLTAEQRFFLQGIPVKSSFIQNLPWAQAKRRLYLPLMPLAIESLDLSWADLVISSSAAVAKGVLTHAGQLHICYCYSPARYAWDLTQQYLQKEGLEKGLKATLVKVILHYIRIWDVVSAGRVDHFVTLSDYVAKRIRKIYQRESTVIYPPVDMEKFQLQGSKEDYYLTMSRLVSYKNIDLIVEVFAQNGKKLLVVGEGPDLKKIKAKATPNVEIMGYQPDEVVRDLMQRAKAFVFAANEEFGIVAVEAQASGTPVIAYGHGGSLETVKGVHVGSKPAAETTGIFFSEQTPRALSAAIDWFELYQDEITPAACRKNAERFSRPRFEKEFSEFVAEKWDAFIRGR